MSGGLDRVESRTERRADRGQVPNEPYYGPWLNTRDLAVYLRYSGKTPLRSVYRFLVRHGIVPRHDGHRLLIARADIDRALTHGGRKPAAVPSTPSMTLSDMSQKGRL